MVISCGRVTRHHGRREVRTEVRLSRSRTRHETSGEETGEWGKWEIHPEGGFPGQAETAIRGEG